MTLNYNKSENTVTITFSNSEIDFINDIAGDKNLRIFYGFNEYPTTSLGYFLWDETYEFELPVTTLDHFYFFVKVFVYTLGEVAGEEENEHNIEYMTHANMFIDKKGIHCEVINKAVENPDILLYWQILNLDLTDCSCQDGNLIKIINIFDKLLDRSNTLSQPKDCGCYG